MSQTRDLLKNTAVLAASRVIDRVSGILLAFFVSRLLHANGMGIYSTAMAYYGLIAMAGEMGSTNLLVRELARDRSRTNSYVVHLSLMATGLSVVVMLLAWIALPHLRYSADLTASLYLILLAVIPGVLNTIQEAVFVAHQRVEFKTLTTLLASIANIVISLYLLLSGYGIVSLVIAFVAIQYLSTICYFYLINRYIVAISWQFQLSTAVRLLKELKVFAASSLLGGLFARPEILLLSFFATEAQIGFYSAALKLVDLWYLIPQTYMINVFPLLSRSYHLADQRFLVIQEKSIKYLLALALPLAVGISVAAEPIIEVVYGPGFEPSATLLRLLAWNIPLFCLHSILWRILAARNQQRLVLNVQVITIFTRLISGFLIISTVAALGAAIVTPLNLLLHNSLLSLHIRRDGTRLDMVRLGWRVGLAAGGMGLIIWLCSAWLPLWVLVPLAVVLYVALTLLFRAFSRDDYALLGKIWSRAS